MGCCCSLPSQVEAQRADVQDRKKQVAEVLAEVKVVNAGTCSPSIHMPSSANKVTFDDDASAPAADTPVQRTVSVPRPSAGPSSGTFSSLRVDTDDGGAAAAAAWANISPRARGELPTTVKQQYVASPNKPGPMLQHTVSTVETQRPRGSLAARVASRLRWSVAADGRTESRKRATREKARDGPCTGCQGGCMECDPSGHKLDIDPWR